MKSAYEYGTQSGEGMMGLICMFNKIKVDKGLDWCPWTNSIIGVCREHSGSSPYVFSNLDDAQVICEDLQVGWIHFGTEVSHTCHGMGKELIKRKQIRQLYLHLGRIPEEEAQVIKVRRRAKAFFLMHRVMWKRNGD